MIDPSIPEALTKHFEAFAPSGRGFLDIIPSEWYGGEESDFRSCVIRWARADPRIEGVGLFPGLIRLNIDGGMMDGKLRVWASDKPREG